MIVWRLNVSGFFIKIKDISKQLRMEQGIKEEVEVVLTRIKPSLGGADVQLIDVKGGIVTVQYHKPLSNPSACHVDRTRTTKELVVEILEDQLKKVVPGFREVALMGEE